MMSSGFELRAAGWRVPTNPLGYELLPFQNIQHIPGKTIKKPYLHTCVNLVSVFATPPAPRRRYLPSPKPNRPSWMQRHLRRPNTVNVDDSTLSGK